MEVQDEEKLTFIASSKKTNPELIPSRKNSYNPDTELGLQKLQQIQKLPFWKRNCRPIKNGSLRGTIITWVRISMGIGVFAVPYFLKTIGATTGFFFIILAAITNYIAFLIIFEASDYTQKQTYPEIVKHMLGDRFHQFFTITMFLEYMSITLLYAMASWSLFQFYSFQFGFFKPEWLLDSQSMTFKEYNPEVFFIRVCYFIVLYLIISKLLLAEKMESQRIISSFFVFIVFSIMLSTIIEAPSYYQYHKQHNLLEITIGSKTPSLHWITSFFAILLTFNTQVMCLDIKKELFHPTFRRLKKVTTIAIIWQCFGALVISLAGYIALGDKYIPSLLFLRKPIYPHSKWEFTVRVLHICFFFAMVIGISILNVPIRRFLLQMQNKRFVTRKTYVIYSLVPMLGIFVIATIFPFITDIINFFGLSIYNINAYLLPFYIKYMMLKSRGNLLKAKFYLLLFFVFLILSVIGTIYLFISGNKQFYKRMVTIKQMFKIVIGVYLAFYYYTEYGLTGKHPKDFTHGVEDIRFLTEKGPLLNEQGILNKDGFSKNKLRSFHKNQLKGYFQKFKFKKFDHFAFVTKEHLIHFSVIDMNYAYNLSLSVYDKSSNKKAKLSLENFPYFSTPPLIPDDVQKCQSYSFIKGNDIVKVEKNPEGESCLVHVTLDTSILKGEFSFKINPKEENIFEQVKVNESGKNWFFGGKYLNLKCTADFTSLNRAIKSEECLALLDEGRTVYNYKTEYVWATGTGKTTDGQILSLNLGYGVMHPKSNGSTDVFKLNNNIHLLHPLIHSFDAERNLHIFQTHPNFRKKKTNTAMISFSPIKDNSHGQNFLIIKAQLELSYGVFNGWLTDSNGAQIKFKDLTGLVEDAKFLW